MTESAMDKTADSLAEEISKLCESDRISVATAESLTGGQLAAVLTAAPDSAMWFRGGIVAYHPEIKFQLLDVPQGPVVTPHTAAQMAVSGAKLLGADFTVAVTGVGGPKPQEGSPAGTVYLAASDAQGQPDTEHHFFDGEPLVVMERTIVAALRALLHRMIAPSSTPRVPTK
ncbi:MAG: CinA family protein [Leucobacter sp.]